MKEVSRGRILALDLLRGFLLAVIAIDHVGRFPNPYELVTGRGILWVSAAEGFFIISGLLVGYLYMHRMKHSPWAATLKIWKRALLLFGLSLFWTLVFTVGAWLAYGNSGIKLGVWQQADLGAFLTSLLTLQYIYGWADFLAYYAQFMLAAPLVVWLITKRLAWLAAASSVAVWFIWREQSFVLGWQVLFMLSIVAGAYLPHIETFIRSLPHRARTVAFRTLVISASSVLAFSAAVVVALPFAVKHQLLGSAQPLVQQFLAVLEAPAGLFSWFLKETLPLPRLALAFFVFSAFYVVFRRYEALIERKTKGVLMALGKQSLFVYCMQAVVVFALNLLVPADVNLVVSTILTTVVIAVLYMGARLRNGMRSIGLKRLLRRFKKSDDTYRLEADE